MKILIILFAASITLNLILLFGPGIWDKYIVTDEEENRKLDNAREVDKT